MVSSMAETWRRHREAYLLLALPLAIIVIFRVLTVGGAFWISVVRYGPRGAPFVGLANYAATLQDDLFWRSMFNTLYYSVGVVPLGIAVSLGLSQLIFNLGRRTQMFYKAAFYLPMVVSGVVMSLVWLWMFDPVYGLLNWLFQQVGLEPLLWLRSPKTAMPSLILMAVATGQGASIVLLTASMGSIPDPLYESARVDGANGWHEFRHITVPLLRPTILYLLIMGTIGSFQVFNSIYVMTSGGPYHATETAVYLLYTYAFQMLNFSRASAIGVILAVILALVSALQYRFVARGSVEY
ncbi:MAG: sugar ABC transporter permease [Anaerolineae bacterium]|nr:sugar ABC transporter permease [Anaerolineae bacterium]